MILIIITTRWFVVGELLSTSIVSSYLNEMGIRNQWLDVRDILRTDDNFRDAQIDWKVTAEKVQEKILPLFQHNNMVITQGFIGCHQMKMKAPPWGAKEVITPRLFLPTCSML